MGYDDYDIDQKPIDKGATSSIYFAKMKNTNNCVAIKFLRLSHIKGNNLNLDLLKSEIIILKKCNSKYILKIIEVFTHNDQSAVVLQYCNSGNLKDYIENQPNKKLTETQSIQLILEIIEGFKELYRINCIHRDIKPENILMHNKSIKIADFGGSTILRSRNQTSTAHFGTYDSMSPERIKGLKYGINQNIYGIGSVFHYMLFGKYPNLISEQQKNQLNLREQTKYFLKKCLQNNPENRFSYDEIFEYNFYESVKSAIPLYIIKYHRKQFDIHADVKSIYPQQISQISKQEIEKSIILQKQNKVFYLLCQLEGIRQKYIEQIKNIMFPIQFLEKCIRNICRFLNKIQQIKSKNQKNQKLQKRQRYQLYIGYLCVIICFQIQQLRKEHKLLSDKKNCLKIYEIQFYNFIQNQQVVREILSYYKEAISKLQNKKQSYYNPVISPILQNKKQKQYIISQNSQGFNQLCEKVLLQFYDQIEGQKIKNQQYLTYNERIQMNLVQYLIVDFIYGSKKTKKQLMDKLNHYGSLKIEKIEQMIKTKRQTQISKLF